MSALETLRSALPYKAAMAPSADSCRCAGRAEQLRTAALELLLQQGIQEEATLLPQLTALLSAQLDQQQQQEHESAGSDSEDRCVFAVLGCLGVHA